MFDIQNNARVKIECDSNKISIHPVSSYPKGVSTMAFFEDTSHYAPRIWKPPGDFYEDHRFLRFVGYRGRGGDSTSLTAH